MNHVEPTKVERCKTFTQPGGHAARECSIKASLGMLIDRQAEVV
jgi:hypothetical protein